MFGALHCIVWLRDLETKKLGAQVLGKVQHVVLEEDVVDKLVRALRFVNMCDGSEIFQTISCVEKPIGLDKL